MKKNNKSISIIIITITIISLLLTSVNAQTNPIMTKPVYDFEYTYSGMTAEEAEAIILSWQNKTSKTQATEKGNLLCVFGHSIKNGNIILTYHSPCKEIKRSVDQCTRSGCTYSKIVSETTKKLYCH